MREINDVQHAVDQRQAQSDQGVDGPGRETIQYLWNQNRKIKHERGHFA